MRYKRHNVCKFSIQDKSRMIGIQETKADKTVLAEDRLMIETGQKGK